MVGPGVPRLRGCGSYAPGHDVHMIPALRAVNGHRDPATGAVPPTLGAVVVDCFENGVVVVDVDGVEQRWWNHDIVRLAGAARAGGGVALVDARWGILRILHGDGGSWCFSIGSAERWAEQRCALLSTPWRSRRAGAGA